jgi:hypothetical protein
MDSVNKTINVEDTIAMLTRAAFGLTIVLASVSGSLAGPRAYTIPRRRRRTALPLRVCSHGLGLAVYAAAGLDEPVK